MKLIPFSRRGGAAAPIAIALLTFLCIVPTLSWMEFSNSMENLNAATALEIRRGGPVFVPTLEGVPRIEKPPLTAWVTAAAIRTSTLLQLDDANDASRAAAYRRLAFEIRWPALLASCLSLFAVYSLGKTCLDARGGLIAMTIAASSLFFLRFARNSTTDVQLMLWVAIANAALARAIVVGLNWKNALASGVAVGLAFMSKGPVALVQSVLPAVVFVLWRLWIANSARATQPRSASEAADSSHAPKLIVATAIALLLALWWFLAVGLGHHDIIHRWLSETNPAGGERISSNNVAEYLVILPFMLPWMVFLIEGWIRSFIEARGGNQRLAYPLFLFTIALVVMTCFHDRKDRYILPLIGVASVLAARSVIAMLDSERRAIPPIVHWMTLTVMALLPLVGMSSKFVQTRAGGAWFSGGFAIAATLVGLLIIAISILRARPVIGAFALMMWLQFVGIRGYVQSREGTSDMRPLAESIRHAYPDTQMFNYRHDGLQKRASVDLSIYLNRITRWVADPNAIEPDPNHRQIYLTLQNHGEPEPQAKAGWTYFDKVPRDKDWYWAFVRN